MTTGEIRQKYLDFFKKRGHKIITTAPLVLAEDPTTLFTSSGMQPLVPYLLGEPHPSGFKRLVDSQPSIRVGDIEEVGDNRHITFFEMLGNWSLGDYFKAEQLLWIFEFLTKELKLDQKKLAVSISAGGNGILEDRESYEIWKKIGIKEDRIFKYPIEQENWWSRSGRPDQMPPGEIGGPDSEVFYEFTEVEHDKKYGKLCHPNCDCGRFLEIGNSVFIQYQKQADGSLKELPQKNVDFGGGLERLAAVVNNDPDIFKIDLLWPLIQELQSLSKQQYGQDKEMTRAMRIIADHLRAATMIAEAGVLPSNKTQGYILRRLLRRAMLFAQKLNLPDTYLKLLVGKIIVSYADIFPGLKEKEQEIIKAFEEEANRFAKALEAGLKELEKISVIDAKSAFYLYESFGIPLEIIIEIALDRNQEFDLKEFKKEQEAHQQLSRQAAAGMFKGGLADQSYEVVKLHTATHLLHAALRQVLNSQVKQEGSNITAERLRFDFSHNQKLTSDQLKEVEDLVNEKIKQNLEVSFEVVDKDAALASGAVAFFREKYDDKVKVYSIGSSTDSGSPFSREVCGGPHINNTLELGKFKIIKQEAVAKGVRRIRAVLENS